MVISPARTCGAVTFPLMDDCQSEGDSSVCVFYLSATRIPTFIFCPHFHVRTGVTVGKWSRQEQQVGQSSRGSGRHEVNMTKCETSLCFTSLKLTVALVEHLPAVLGRSLMPSHLLDPFLIFTAWSGVSGNTSQIIAAFTYLGHVEAQI